MRVFEDIEEARKWHRNYTELVNPVKTESLLGSNPKIKLGDWVLFQHIYEGETISRPILGLFVGWGAMDHALVFNYVESPRAYLKFSFKKTKHGECSYDLCDPDIQYVAIWSDDVHRLGSWGRKPSISELKDSMKNRI